MGASLIGEFAPGEGYSPEGVAVADAAIEQQEADKGRDEAGGDAKGHFDELQVFCHLRNCSPEVSMHNRAELAGPHD